MKSTALFSAIFLLLLGLSGCPQNLSAPNGPDAAPPTLVLNDTSDVAFGGTIHNQEEDLWLTFDSLGSDSRCPVDVLCVWAGNAELFFELSQHGQTARFELNTFADYSTSQTVFNYEITLVAVRPFPHGDSLYTAADYTASVTIRKTE